MTRQPRTVEDHDDGDGEPTRHTMDELLTVAELAEWLKVPPSWIYERTRRRGEGQLPCLKLGKYLRFEEAAVRVYLEQQRRSA